MSFVGGRTPSQPWVVVLVPSVSAAVPSLPGECPEPGFVCHRVCSQGDGWRSSPDGRAACPEPLHVSDFCLLSARAGSRRAGFTPLSGRWLFPWILTRTSTSTGGTWSSSTRAGSSTRGLPTCSLSPMLLTKPWRDDPKTPALSSQVGCKACMVMSTWSVWNSRPKENNGLANDSVS